MKSNTSKEYAPIKGRENYLLGYRYQTVSSAITKGIKAIKDSLTKIKQIKVKEMTERIKFKPKVETILKELRSF